jgi:Mg-chelatase subunit ChlD
MFRVLFLILLSPAICRAQLNFTDQQTDLGTIAEAHEIKGDVVIKNSGAKKVFLMRADADKGIKVFASKKTLQPNDTALLIISFIPENSGKFKKKISLVSSDSEKPYLLQLNGNLDKLKADDKLACFYFGSRKKSNIKIKDEPVVVKDFKEPRGISNKMPDHPSEPVVTYTPPVTFKEEIKNDDTTKLSILKYKPNNILFLVDVSGSMADSLKLPLMKIALYILIDEVREIDKITFVTYCDGTKVIKEGISGSDKKQLLSIVASLKAKGLTKGNEAILKSQAIAQKHFISEGNNQIIMASDGEFLFNETDYKKWKANQGDKKIILTTVAFGHDKKAIKNLKGIAEKGEGSFIHIQKKNAKEDALLEEIRMRSKRN